MSKASGINQFQLTKEFDERDLKQAFDKKLFQVFYQPQVSLADPRKIIGAEACVRIKHEKFGILVPSLFLPLVRQSNQLLRMTQIVLEQVIKDWLQWKSQGFELQLSINIEQELLTDDHFADFMIEKVQSSILPSRFTLEVTHQLEEELDEHILKRMFNLKLRGFRFSLDNSHNEYDHIDQLIKYPIDEIKINRDVVNRISTHTCAREKINRTLDAANRLGVSVVAVGIENPADSEWLLNNACDTGQGYLFGRPSAADDFYELFLVKEKVWQVDDVWERAKILVVDNDENYRKLYEESLSELFIVEFAHNELEAQNLFKVFKPDVMILENNLPDSNDICFTQKIADDPHSKHCSVMFISSEDSMDLKLQAYATNALDYLVKPVSITELIAKICRITVLQKKRQQLMSNVQEVERTAHLSMQEAAVYGGVVNFFRVLMACNDEASIKKALFQFTEQKQLQCSVQFRNRDTIVTFDQCNIVCSPIEMKVFELLRLRGRIYEFSQRCIINYEHVSCLVKNMPTDPELSGAARDYLAIIVEGIEARYSDILRQRAISSVTDKLKNLANSLTSAIKEELSNKKKLMENLEMELNMSFHILGLTDEQEVYLTNIIESTIDTAWDSETTTLSTIDSINQVVLLLSESSSNKANEDKDEGHVVEEQVDIPENVELF